MKNLVLLILSFNTVIGYTQVNLGITDSTIQYKKRVLDSSEIAILGSYYMQDGSNAAVTGGIGTEELNNFATNINISVPLNDDDILSIDGTISAYTSASSSNLNPFPDEEDRGGTTNITGSPWVAATGASRHDVWLSGKVGYSHSSDDRNTIWNSYLNIANEYDYFSFGFGGGIAKLYNQKNTQIGIHTSIYLDTWRPVYPIEIENSGYFRNVNIWDENANLTNLWSPPQNKFISDSKRNSYTLSFIFSQIISKKAQLLLSSDIVFQNGWLANPMQRVYFADKDNFYVGNPKSIPIYTSSENKDVFHLADDIERLPLTRLKIPVGMRFNYYINEFLVLRTYYRFYYDDWGIYSHTAYIELPIKISSKFTIYPSYRFYQQTASKYFAPYEQHLSSDIYYTSDYDLSYFSSNQIGMGLKYTDVQSKGYIWKFGLKDISLNYNYYFRNASFKAQIISLGANFVLDK